MPARPGNWALLGHSSDPVAGDPDQLQLLITYYAKVADTIKSEATTLQRIGAGDTTELKGQSADAIRSRSKDVAASLTQTSGRYDAVARALAVYGPALDTARSESARALQEADAADGASRSSAALPDPTAARASDAPPLTDEENVQIHARTNAISEAAESGGLAQRRMDAAMGALNAAGKSASNLIRGAWDDGLVDTWQYKLREGFLKFLKILVKVLMWIGVALAVLAFFIPGLGAAALAGAIVAVASVVGTFALAAMGEGSWLDAILAVVGVVLIGVGVIVAKVVQTAHVAAIARGSSGAARSGTGPLATSIASKSAVAASKRQAAFADGLEGRISVSAAMKRINAIDKRLHTITNDMQAGRAGQIASKNAIKPQWWNVGTKGWGPNDIAKFGDFGKKYRFDRLFSTDRVGDYKKLQASLQAEFGLAPKAIPWWYYANAGRVVGNFGISTLKWSTTPTGFGTDTSRSATSPEYDAAKTALTSPTK
ncbi:hypothetical protein ACT3TS_17955 [Specibacter sp. AOP5-B1-6]|uniref:hypothetical protein n=1 Tax=Specibacter sp. AOP5-B1-6 TaxID=3457653 RepID=UPI003FB94C15